MMDAVLEALAENAVIAAAIAVVATVVLRITRSAPVAHALYIVALAKLVTPALIGLPVLGSEERAEPAMKAAIVIVTEDLRSPVAAPAAPVAPFAEVSLPPPTLGLSDALFGAWALGALAVLVVGLRRRRRFDALVRRADPAPRRVAAIARDVADRLGLRSTPELRVADARLSPVVFRARGRAIVLLPRVAVRGLDDDELRAVLAHELCHLANRDHWTRVLESVVVAVHWWNPIAWWVRRGLRDSEELRCDARALTLLESGSRHYGRTILKTVSYVDGDVSGLPLAVSALGGPESLKKRLMMIAENKTDHRLSRIGKVAMAFGAAALLPLGLVAQDPDSKGGSRAEKLEQIRVLLREIKQEIAVEAQGAHEHAKKVEKTERRVLRLGGGGAGMVIRGDDGDLQGPEGKVQVRVMKKGEDGELRELDLGRLRQHPEAHGEPQAMKIQVMIGEDGVPHVKTEKVEVEGCEHGESGEHCEHGEHGEHCEHGEHGEHGAHGEHGEHGEHGAHAEHGQQKHGMFVLRGLPQKNGSFVWKSDDGHQAKVDIDVDVEIEGLEDLPAMIRKMIKAHGGEGHGVHVFGGDDGDMPAGIQALIERHADGDAKKKAHAFVLRTDGDGAAFGAMPEQLKKLIEAHGADDCKVQVFGGDCDEHAEGDAKKRTRTLVLRGGDGDAKKVEMKVLGIDGAALPPEVRARIQKHGEGAGVRVLRRTVEKKPAAGGDETEQLRKQLRQLEKQLRELEKKLEHMHRENF